MLAGQLEQEQVSVVARLLTFLQCLLVSHILANVTVILQVCASGGSNLTDKPEPPSSISSGKCCGLDIHTLTAIDNS